MSDVSMEYELMNLVNEGYNTVVQNIDVLAVAAWSLGNVIAGVGQEFARNNADLFNAKRSYDIRHSRTWNGLSAAVPAVSGGLEYLFTGNVSQAAAVAGSGVAANMAGRGLANAIQGYSLRKAYEKN